MDTNDLSTETYDGILLEAEKFHHDLALQFGVMASGCINEEEYLNESEQLISELRLCSKEDLYIFFFGNLPDIKSLDLALNRISENISKVRKIPEKQRHYEF